MLQISLFAAFFIKNFSLNIHAGKKDDFKKASFDLRKIKLTILIK